MTISLKKKNLEQKNLHNQNKIILENGISRKVLTHSSESLMCCRALAISAANERWEDPCTKKKIKILSVNNQEDFETMLILYLQSSKFKQSLQRFQVLLKERFNLEICLPKIG